MAEISNIRLPFYRVPTNSFVLRAYKWWQRNYIVSNGISYLNVWNRQELVFKFSSLANPENVGRQIAHVQDPAVHELSHRQEEQDLRLYLPGMQERILQKVELHWTL